MINTFDEFLDKRIDLHDAELSEETKLEFFRVFFDNKKAYLYSTRLSSVLLYLFGLEVKVVPAHSEMVIHITASKNFLSRINYLENVYDKTNANYNIFHFAVSEPIIVNLMPLLLSYININIVELSQLDKNHYTVFEHALSFLKGNFHITHARPVISNIKKIVSQLLPYQDKSALINCKISLVDVITHFNQDIMKKYIHKLGVEHFFTNSLINTLIQNKCFETLSAIHQKKSIMDKIDSINKPGYIIQFKRQWNNFINKQWLRNGEYKHANAFLLQNQDVELYQNQVRYYDKFGVEERKNIAKKLQLTLLVPMLYQEKLPYELIIIIVSMLGNSYRNTNRHQRPKFYFHMTAETHFYQQRELDIEYIDSLSSLKKIADSNKTSREWLEKFTPIFNSHRIFLYDTQRKNIFHYIFSMVPDKQNTPFIEIIFAKISKLSNWQINLCQYSQDDFMTPICILNDKLSNSSIKIEDITLFTQFINENKNATQRMLKESGQKDIIIFEYSQLVNNNNHDNSLSKLFL